MSNDMIDQYLRSGRNKQKWQLIQLTQIRTRAERFESKDSSIMLSGLIIIARSLWSHATTSCRPRSISFNNLWLAHVMIQLQKWLAPVLTQIAKWIEFEFMVYKIIFCASRIRLSNERLLSLPPDHLPTWEDWVYFRYLSWLCEAAVESVKCWLDSSLHTLNLLPRPSFIPLEKRIQIWAKFPQEIGIFSPERGRSCCVCTTRTTDLAAHNASLLL